MFVLFAEALPQPVSEPVHYSWWQFFAAFFIMAVIAVVVIIVLRKLNPKIVTPQVIIITVLLSMFCQPAALVYLFIVYKTLQSDA